MKIACLQSNVAFRNPLENARLAVEKIHDLAAAGTNLVVLPEAFLTGYCVNTPLEAEAIAIPARPIPHEALTVLKQASDSSDTIVVVGFAETLGGALYNSAAIFIPGQEGQYYQKTHLPCLGLDRFVTPGRELPVFETRFGRLGVLICYDLRPPEATRTLALKGADILILPTNWPAGAESSAEHVVIARAVENHIFVASCNRVGTENGFNFIGRSKIIDPSGNIVAKAGGGEEVISADVDLMLARQKRRVIRPGTYELEIMGCRRPELYGPNVEQYRDSEERKP